jgi:hypothetical protein
LDLKQRSGVEKDVLVLLELLFQVEFSLGFAMGAFISLEDHSAVAEAILDSTSEQQLE